MFETVREKVISTIFVLVALVGIYLTAQHFIFEWQESKRRAYHLKCEELRLLKKTPMASCESLLAETPDKEKDK